MEDSQVAVLLEDLRAQFRVFGEGLKVVRQELKGQINGLEQKLDAEIEQNAREHRLNRQEHQQMIEQNREEHRVMMQMFEQNREEHRLMMQMIRDLRYDFQVELKRVK